MKTVVAAVAAFNLVGSASATGTVLLSLEKKGLVNGNLQPLKGAYKREAGTVSSNVFDVQPWSPGGAYYTNGMWYIPQG